MCIRDRFRGQPFVPVDSGAAGATMLALRHSGVDVDAGMLARVRGGIRDAAAPTHLSRAPGMDRDRAEAEEDATP